MVQMGVTSHRDLRVWQQAMELAEQAYRMTAQLPRNEAFELSAQIRRSAVSVPANIAEGYGRGSRGSYLQFLKTARGSLLELETQVLLAHRVGLLDRARIDPLIVQGESVGKLLNSLIRSVRVSSGPPNRE